MLSPEIRYVTDLMGWILRFWTQIIQIQNRVMSQIGIVMTQAMKQMVKNGMKSFSLCWGDHSVKYTQGSPQL